MFSLSSLRQVLGFLESPSGHGVCPTTSKCHHARASTPSLHSERIDLMHEDLQLDCLLRESVGFYSAWCLLCTGVCVSPKFVC